MHRRHQHINIPTELMRTLAVVGETQNFSKAGERLGLSQPAISAQIKRLQIIVGGLVFQKAGHGGLELTPRGRLALGHARKLLEANDQILSLAAAANDVAPVRLGIAVLYAEEFLATWKAARSPLPVHYFCDVSAEVSKGLSEGFLDVGCILDDGLQLENFAFSWDEEMVWVRSPDFVLSPGAPIPLVSWPGGHLDMQVINALERANIGYRMVFASADHQSRLAAVVAGLGIMGMPKRRVKEPLVIAREYYLPKLGQARAGVATRSGFDPNQASDLMVALSKLAPEHAPFRN